MQYGLPTSLEVNGTEYAINSDFRRILDILEILGDAEFTDDEKVFTALAGFYEDSIPLADCEEALKQCYWFINGGTEEDKTPSPRLMDWAQDFPHIVAPVNRVMGKEIRSLPYLHWWSFLSAYQEIGDCLFAQIVGIRNKKARGKKLDKSEQEFYRRNRKMVDLKQQYTAADDATINMWLGKKETAPGGAARS